MRRADRLLQIVQILRRSSTPVTAQQLAEELEVVPRTIYRDIVTLQATGVPVDGETGVGYLLRPGYDLPPLMFDSEQVEAIVLGLAMVAKRGDQQLVAGAKDALAKIRVVVPPDVSGHVDAAKVLVPHKLEPGVSFGDHLPLIRKAIRERRKLAIRYTSRAERTSDRTIWPLGLYFYSHVTLLCTWCEQQSDFRAFRTERIGSCLELPEHFDARNGALMEEFVKRKLADS